MGSGNIPDSHLFESSDLHLWELPQVFAASSMWHDKGMQDQIATFDLSIREMPEKRNFLLFGGLEEITKGILEWNYTKEESNYLSDSGLVSKEFAGYLKNFKFTGDLYAMPEGTVFFAKEPVLRITAPLPEANLFSMFLMNSVSGNTKFLSKIIRCVLASTPKKCIGVAGLRAESFESAMKCARASFIAGATGGTSIPQFARKFKLKPEFSLTNAYHAVIKSFPTELEAMETMTKLFNGKINLMVDTYDFKQGMENAVQVIKKMKANSLSLPGIMLDSGNLLKQAKKARQMLEKNNLEGINITAASNLDEYKIQELNKKGFMGDAYLIATEAITVPDAPKLETVYKLAELSDGKRTKFTAKFAKGKESLPGKKQVFRTWKNKKMQKDTVGLEGEKKGKPLLIQIIKEGKQAYDLPGLEKIREYVQQQIIELPERLLQINKKASYNVSVSKSLKNLFLQVKKENHS